MEVLYEKLREPKLFWLRAFGPCVVKIFNLFSETNLGVNPDRPHGRYKKYNLKISMYN